jgi:hypothetical protein
MRIMSRLSIRLHINWRAEICGYPPMRPTTPATKTCRRGPR